MEGVEFFRRKEANVKKQRLDSLQNPFFQKSKKVVMVLYLVSLQIARKKAAFSIEEELIKPTAIDMVRQMCGKVNYVTGNGAAFKRHDLEADFGHFNGYKGATYPKKN